MIRIIVAGSRNFNNYSLLEQSLMDYIAGNFDPNDIEIISGGARGADSLGERFARTCQLKLKRFPADWDRYGKSAGYLRNAEMADYAKQETGVLFAFWDGQSRGTQHMINLATTKGLEVHVVKF